MNEEQNWSEDKLQGALWSWAWNTYPERRHQMWAVPNGLHLTGRAASIAKATGLLSGVWDLHVFNRGKFHIIETKIGNSQLTVDRIVNGKKIFGQKEWGELMTSHGAIRHIYRMLDEGKEIYESIFKPLRTLASLTKDERTLISMGLPAKMRNYEASASGYRDMQFTPQEVLKLCAMGVDIFNTFEL